MPLSRDVIDLLVAEAIETTTDLDYRMSWVSSETAQAVFDEGNVLHCFRFAQALLAQDFEPWQISGPLHARKVRVGDDWVLAFWRTWQPYRRPIVDVASEAL